MKRLGESWPCPECGCEMFYGELGDECGVALLHGAATLLIDFWWWMWGDVGIQHERELAWLALVHSARLS